MLIWIASCLAMTRSVSYFVDCFVPRNDAKRVWKRNVTGASFFWHKNCCSPKNVKKKSFWVLLFPK